MNAVAAEENVQARRAGTYFERFDKGNLFHASAHRDTDWLLSDREGSEPGTAGQLINALQPPDDGGR